MKLTKRTVEDFCDTYPQYWNGDWDEEKAIEALCDDWLEMEHEVRRLKALCDSYEAERDTLRSALEDVIKESEDGSQGDAIQAMLAVADAALAPAPADPNG